MANIDLYKQKLVAIGSAIRTKLNVQTTYKLEEMPAAILSISTGEQACTIIDGYTFKNGNFSKDYSFSAVTTFSDITIKNGYEPVSLIRS